MCVPALQTLRERFPGARITILAKPWVAGLYAREPFADEVIPYTQGYWATARVLRERHFDAAVLLQNAFEAALIVWLARIPVRIGYKRDARGALLTRAVPAPGAGEIPRHQRFYYLELVRRAGLIDDIPESDAIRLT